MGHSFSDNAEKILDKKIPVLDKGFVCLVDYLGSDDRIVQSARVSYGKGTKTVREDIALIDYLMRNEHTSPFEQVVLTFHVKMPIFVARQWIRHRTARINEISGRYSIMPDEFYIPDDKYISFQNKHNKQGRGETVDRELQEKIQEDLNNQQSAAYKVYNSLIELGVARELARVILPLSLYTQCYWQIDLHNLFHFLSLRLDSHAQYEIRAYANTILRIAEAVAPHATASFRKYYLGSIRFTEKERELLYRLLRTLDIASEKSNDKEVEIPSYIHKEIGSMNMTKREQELFIEKLRFGEKN